jgi:plasmid stability protein
MPTKEMVAVRLPEELKKKLKLKAKQQNRSMTNQMENYLKIALIAEDNPDLPYSFIKDILEAREEKLAGMGRPFKFRTR